jgi:hypothetical protein
LINSHCTRAKRKKNCSGELYDIGWSAPAVIHTLNALNCPKWRHPEFDSSTAVVFFNLLQQVSNGSGQLLFKIR